MRKHISYAVTFSMSFLLTGVFLFNPVIANADSMKTVTLGADLNEDQKEIVMSYFGITDENKSEFNFITINNKEEHEALDGIIPVEQIGSKTYSCACVEPTPKGGIVVNTTNLNYVTDNMIASALTTAGVTNCNVIAASPFEVSGTGALTGAMKAYENSTDEELDADKKEIANEEIKTSVDLSDKIGDDEATDLINDVKEDVIEDTSNGKDLTEDEIKKMIDDALAEKNLALTEEDHKQLEDLMLKISEQEYDLDTIKDNLQGISDNIKNAVDSINSDETQKEILETANESKNILEKILDSITNFFNSLFGSKDSNSDNSASTESAAESTTESSAESETEASMYTSTESSAESETEVSMYTSTESSID